jgi:hypothetical protein
MPYTITTGITDAVMTRFGNIFMIVESRPFVNGDAGSRFKFDSGTTQNEAIRLMGKRIRISKQGWKIPLFFRYEYVVMIDEAH